MLLSTFKRLLRNYYLEALHSCYDAEDPASSPGANKKISCESLYERFT